MKVERTFLALLFWEASLTFASSPSWNANPTSYNNYGQQPQQYSNPQHHQQQQFYQQGNAPNVDRYQQQQQYPNQQLEPRSNYQQVQLQQQQETADDMHRNNESSSPSTSLPPGWSEHFDPASGQPYYYNSNDGTTTWDRPEFEHQDTDANDNSEQEGMNNTVTVDDVVVTADLADKTLSTDSHNFQSGNNAYTHHGQEHNTASYNNDRDASQRLDNTHAQHGGEFQRDGAFQGERVDSYKPYTSTWGLPSVQEDNNKKIPLAQKPWQPSPELTQHANLHEKPLTDQEASKSHHHHPSNSETREQSWEMPGEMDRDHFSQKTHDNLPKQASPSTPGFASTDSSHTLDTHSSQHSVHNVPAQVSQNGSLEDSELQTHSLQQQQQQQNHSPPQQQLQQNLPPRQPLQPKLPQQQQYYNQGLQSQQGQPRQYTQGQQVPPQQYMQQSLQQNAVDQRQNPPRQQGPPQSSGPQQSGVPPYGASSQYSPDSRRQAPPNPLGLYNQYNPYPSPYGAYGDSQNLYTSQQQQSQHRPGGGVLTPYNPNQEQQGSPVREVLGSAWQGILGFGNRTKEAVETAKNQVVTGAEQASKTLTTTGSSWWGQAKNTFGSIFEHSTNPYSLSGTFGSSSSTTDGNQPQNYAQNNYPDQQRGYPLQRQTQSRYPQGYSPQQQQQQGNPALQNQIPGQQQRLPQRFPLSQQQQQQQQQRQQPVQNRGGPPVHGNRQSQPYGQMPPPQGQFPPGYRPPQPRVDPAYPHDQNRRPEQPPMFNRYGQQVPQQYPYGQQQGSPQGQQLPSYAQQQQQQRRNDQYQQQQEGENKAPDPWQHPGLDPSTMFQDIFAATQSSQLQAVNMWTSYNCYKLLVSCLAFASIQSAAGSRYPFKLGIRDSFMIAHSFHDHPAFGPAGGLHGATYTCDVEFATNSLNPDTNWVIDIGKASEILAAVLVKYNFKNLDVVFANKELTTTEFMCRQIYADILNKLKEEQIDFDGEICIKLFESHKAWASYTGPC